MITKLKNPFSRQYEDVKDLFTSSMIQWTNNMSGGRYGDEKSVDEGHEFIPFLSHALLTRPEMYGFSVQSSQFLPMVVNLLMEILALNGKTPVKCFHRINANVTFPTEKMWPSEPHVDHKFPHENMLIYLTDKGGATVVGDEVYEPKEDDIICFPGHLLHYIHPPKTGGRVIIVATYETVN